MAVTAARVGRRGVSMGIAWDRNGWRKKENGMKQKRSVRPHLVTGFVLIIAFPACPESIRPRPRSGLSRLPIFLFHPLVYEDRRKETL